MRAQTTTRFAALATLVGAVARGGNTARTDTDQAAAAKDSASVGEGVSGQLSSEGEYRVMEGAPSMVPPIMQTHTDHFLTRQQNGPPDETAVCSTMERV